MNKKIFGVLLVALLCFTFVSCQQKGADASSSSSSGSVAADKKINPLTGELTDWEGAGEVRPVSFTINNIYEAIPQRGIGSADMIYEMETEGGITRMLAVFSDYENIPQVGSLRSARHNFFEITRPLNTIFVHFGGSYVAYDYIGRNSLTTIDGNYYSSYFTFDKIRNQTKNSEHCWFIDSEILKTLIEEKKIEPAAKIEPVFKFTTADELPVFPETTAERIKFSFSGYNNKVTLTYDKETGLYLKGQYGDSQIDELTGGQLGFRNAFVLFAPVSRYGNDSLLVDYTLESGEGYYFTLGRMEKITWTKGGDTEHFQFYKEDGTPLQVNAGKTYTALVSNYYQNSIEIA